MKPRRILEEFLRRIAKASPVRQFEDRWEGFWEVSLRNVLGGAGEEFRRHACPRLPHHARIRRQVLIPGLAVEPEDIREEQRPARGECSLGEPKKLPLLREGQMVNRVAREDHVARLGGRVIGGFEIGQHISLMEVDLKPRSGQLMGGLGERSLRHIDARVGPQTGLVERAPDEPRVASSGACRGSWLLAAGWDVLMAHRVPAQSSPG